jgi:membrane protein implicated in regulation of membrane protease activity
LDWDIVFWAAIAALAFVGELLSVSFFLLFFSLGALTALGMAFLGFGLVPQAVGFVAASVVSMFVLRPAIMNRLALHGGEPYVSSNSITGRTGVVTSPIEPGGKGMIRIGNGEFWTARSLYPDREIGQGTRVRVLDTDGLTALVEAVEIGEGEAR